MCCVHVARVACFLGSEVPIGRYVSVMEEVDKKGSGPRTH